MPQKEIHIVFQTIEFVYGDAVRQFNILPIDKHILILLSKFHGPKGIYPRIDLIAHKLDCTPTYIKERINYLDEQKLIKVNRRKGCVHHYELLFLSTDRSTPVDHYPSTPVDRLEFDRSTADEGSGQPQFQNRSTPVDTINTNNQYIESIHTRACASSPIGSHTLTEEQRESGRKNIRAIMNGLGKKLSLADKYK